MDALVWYHTVMRALGRISVFVVLVVTFCTGLFLVAIWSVDDAITHTSNQTLSFNREMFDTSKITARSFVVFDVQTGTEIISKEPKKVLPTASVAKLVAAALVYADSDIDATTSIQWSDVNTDGEAGKLHVGEVYSIRELTYPLLLESSNDASVVLLRVIPVLIYSMNTYIQSLGLSETVFFDTSGLSASNVSTAGELAIIARDIFIQNPHIFDITRLNQFIGTHTGWRNNNPLVHEQGYRGGKHGFTYEADRTVVAFFDETLIDGSIRTVGYVLLSSGSLQADIPVLRSQIKQLITLR